MPLRAHDICLSPRGKTPWTRNFDGRRMTDSNLVGFPAGSQEDGRAHEEAVLSPSSPESCFEPAFEATLGEDRWNMIP
jgi:hypothetical protein